MFRTEKINFGEVNVHLLYYTDFNINDYLSCLLPEEIERLNEFSSETRKKEFLATRYLRTQLVGKTPVLYSDIGAPYLSSGDYISISHAKEVVGIASCPSFPIGFDLEPIHEKVLRVKHKFLHPSELVGFDVDDVTELIKIWSAKEALYKLSGSKGLHFTRDLIVEKINATEWKGKILEEITEKTVHLSIQQISNFIVSISTQPLKLSR